MSVYSYLFSPKTKREREGKKTREQSTPFLLLLLLLHLLLSVNEKIQRETETLSRVCSARVFVVAFWWLRLFRQKV